MMTSLIDAITKSRVIRIRSIRVFYFILIILNGFYLIGCYSTRHGHDREKRYWDINYMEIVHVRTEPAKCRIYINEEYIGISPLETTIDVGTFRLAQTGIYPIKFIFSDVGVAGTDINVGVVPNTRKRTGDTRWTDELSFSNLKGGFTITAFKDNYEEVNKRMQLNTTDKVFQRAFESVKINDHGQTQIQIHGERSVLLSLKPIASARPISPTIEHQKEEIEMSGESVTQRWAVVIGISNYEDTRIPPLRYASSDAKSFYDWLISPDDGGYAPANVKLLSDREATHTNIKKSLFEWLGQALEEDVVTIFFAGHGSPQSPDHTNNLFLLPYDVQYNSIASTGFPMWDIETALKRFIRAKKVVVIADACHSGGVGHSFDVERRANRSVEVNPISSGFQNLSSISDGVAVISASDDKQLSQESQKWGNGHGVFTFFLLKGLKGGADYNQDNRVSLGELIPFLSEHVRRETRNAQSPTVAGKFDPALTIGR